MDKFSCDSEPVGVDLQFEVAEVEHAELTQARRGDRLKDRRAVLVSLGSWHHPSRPLVESWVAFNTMPILGIPEVNAK
jgi:hypothetical protein